MIEANEVAWALRNDDPADVYLEQAEIYFDLASDAAGRAVYHADRGDRHVAYDEATDARYGMELGAVHVVAWLATIAKVEAVRRAMTLDCGVTEGEQMKVPEDRR